MTARSADTAGTRSAETASRLVLIVDDNEKNLKLTRDVLQFAGFRTLEAASGAAGIALAVEHVPDVILMDLRLGDMDGSDAARALGEEPRTARIPIVALSSLPLERGSEWARTTGFAGYLEKPFDVGELPRQVLRFCAAAVGG